MSVDGPGIFQSDTAHDVRSEFRERLSKGQSAGEASMIMAAEWAPANDPNDRTDFWIALAASQVELGQLQVEIKDRVLRIIESGEDLHRWAPPAMARKRELVLASLARKLSGLQKAPSLPRRRLEIPPLQWKPGAIYTYRLRDESLCLLRSLEIAEFQGSEPPVVELLQWEGWAVPEPVDFDHLGIMRASRFHPLKFIVFSASLREYKGALKRLCLAGQSTDYRRSTTRCTVQPTTWGKIDGEISSWFGIGGV
ncbi:hypothetical protein [Hydrocarboniphaga sp.]|uniref:hypothetical protein n=1 Tax=Hydrocarboniphaga sp. TaxID=2033016 RepID=UPI00261F70DF|nr:hypothetical protein [Hydrocarboniphaga sp.]